MTEDRTLPESYKALEVLNICSNKIIGGGKIIGINDFAPILIGTGNVPNVWLYGKNRENGWVLLVDDNFSLNPSVKIKRDILKRGVTIKIDRTVLLDAKMTSNKECKVVSIDLRPIGLNVVGNSQELKVGEARFSDNTFHGKGFMIGFSE